MINFLKRFFAYALYIPMAILVFVLFAEMSRPDISPEESDTVLASVGSLLAFTFAVQYALFNTSRPRLKKLKKPKKPKALVPVTKVDPEPQERKLAAIPYIDFDDNELQPAQATLPDTMRRFVLAGDSKINQSAGDSA